MSGTLLEAVSQPVWQRVTITLVHFLWQGMAVAMLLSVVIDLFRIRSARTRYVLSLGALVLLAACPLVTFFALDAPQTAGHQVAAAEESIDHHQRADIVFHSEAETEAPSVESGPAAIDTAAATTMRKRLDRVALGVQPFVFVAWILGVLLLSARLLLSFAGAHWVRCGRRQLPTEVSERVKCLGRQMRLCRAVEVFSSRRVKQAMVVGFYRPVVLLPVAWLTEMPVASLKAIVAHELAHIRRFDLWVNLFQRFVETLLFYHPAIWWLSRRVRVEREMCCDELAIAATGERVVYASTLTLVASRHLAGVRPGVAAAIGGERKMTLLSRVRNVLGKPPAQQKGRWWPVGLVLLVLTFVIWGTTAPFGLADDDDDERPEARERERDRDRAGDRERERDGDRDDREREGDRERAERDRPPRDGDREGPRPTLRRDGDGPRPPIRPDADRDRPSPDRRPDFRPDPTRRPSGDRPDFRPARDGDRPAPVNRDEALMRTLEQLRHEVMELRREVQELKRGRQFEGFRRVEEEVEQQRRISEEQRRRAMEALQRAKETRESPFERRERDEERPRRRPERDDGEEEEEGNE